jgi:Asp-tRNA(Asn)/Glu-tRNA(Gln) amidotransferase A subunit family amidase
LPVGLQILGPVLGEERVLEVGHVVEQAMRDIVENKKPKIW